MAVSALRSVLSAIGNAEAVGPPPVVAGTGSPYIAGAVAGLATGEVQRRSLSTAEVDQIIRAEIGERLIAAGDYDRRGHADRAERLRSEARVLRLAASHKAAPQEP